MRQRSAFIHPVPYQPSHFAPRVPPSRGLRREVPVEPGPFVAGLELYEQGRPPLPPNLERAPVDLHFYLGRVEDVAEDGTVTATLWECPGGAELLATLSLAAHFAPEPRPVGGDALRVWSWLEYEENGQEIERVSVQVRRPSWTEEERATLGELLERLQETPEHE